MKIFIIAILFAFFLTPVFSQDANEAIYRSLNDSMGTKVSHSTETLEYFDRAIVHDDQGKTYASFRLRFEALERALLQTELTLERLIRYNATPGTLRTERDRYENYLNQLENLKDAYETWLGNIQ